MSTLSNKCFGAALFAAAAFSLPASCLAGSNSTYGLGIEGFYDNYKEDDLGVNNKAEYGSITANYSHSWNAFFAALDGRASYGQDKYSSPDGSVSGVPQWEFELRPRIGYMFSAPGGSIAPYIGLGLRYYMDEFKGETTTTNGQTFSGYDRRITQFYLPVGATYIHTTSNGWTISPNLEYDQLLWGQVSSRIGTVPGNVNTINDQDSGWGARGSIMFGKQENNWSWQVGPFVRYWDIQSSDVHAAGIAFDPNTGQNELLVGEEPANTRLQVGLAVRAIW